jgi:hypothetical protein
MSMKKWWAASLISLVALVFNFQLVLAHETITVGNYEIEVGWLTEPPIAGVQNAIVVNVSDTSSGEEQPVEDVSALTVTVSYGGQSKPLTLQPLGEDTPGQFVGPILPTIPGKYDLILGGSLGDTTVAAETHVEEVQPADTLAFPSVNAAQPSGKTDWLVWLSILIGLIGVGVGITALRKASTR